MKTYTPVERINHLDLPNLFDYATKELSQDAFLCWALEWKNISGHEMCGFAYLCNKINNVDLQVSTGLIYYEYKI